MARARRRPPRSRPTRSSAEGVVTLLTYGPRHSAGVRPYPRLSASRASPYGGRIDPMPGDCRKHGPWLGAQIRCPICNQETRRAWAIRNTPHLVAKARAWEKDNPGKVNARKRAAGARVKREAIDAYGGKCACCGITDLVFLTIDHVERNGAAHRRELFGAYAGGGERFYRWLRRNNWPEGCRVLCWNCQHATFRGTCPHQP